MPLRVFLFFVNDTATTEIYTLSLHDALPISDVRNPARRDHRSMTDLALLHDEADRARYAAAHIAAEQVTEVRVLQRGLRSEEHTSELQSRQYLVCRLLLEKKK